jgi:hypothetical protein
MSINNNSSALKTILLSIDLFGVEPSLNYNNRDTFNTKTGGVTSLVFFMVLIMGCAYFGQELVNGQKPTILQADINDSHPRRFNLTLDKFGVFFGIQNSKDFIYYIDPTIYQIKTSIEFIDMTYDENNQPVFTFSSKPIRNEQCVLERHFPNFIKEFKSQPLNGLSCIHPDDANSVYIESTWGENSYAYLYAKILCV